MDRPYGAGDDDFNALLAHPPWKHLLGTDEFGRDVFSRIIWGSRASMQAGFLATMLAMVIAVPIGLVAGYYRGWVDTVIARLTDVLLAFPFLILAVGLAAILGPSLKNATIALGISSVPGFIRIARGEALALREEDYVPAAVVNGANDATIIFKHILPNMTNTLIVQATVTIPLAIVGEAVLSFLGLGVSRRRRRWGTMLQDAQSYLAQAPRLAVYPGIALGLPRSPSTCSATACGTSSIRARRADGGGSPRGGGPVGALRADDGPVHAVDRVSFTLGAGEILGMVGESGCGKSVTSLSLVRRSRAAHDQRPRSPRRRRPARAPAAAPAARARPRDLDVFQEPMTSLNPVFTVGRQIAEVLRGTSELCARGRAATDRVELLGRSAFPPASAGSTSIRTSSPAACASA